MCAGFLCVRWLSLCALALFVCAGFICVPEVHQTWPRKSEEYCMDKHRTTQGFSRPSCRPPRITHLPPLLAQHTAHTQHTHHLLLAQHHTHHTPTTFFLHSITHITHPPPLLAQHTAHTRTHAPPLLAQHHTHHPPTNGASHCATLHRHGPRTQLCSY